MTDIAILDIEASGLHFDSYPIEIAVRVGGQIHAWLIRPEPGWVHWDEHAERLHGISRAHLLQHGLPAATVARAINDAAQTGDGVFFSDNAPWDEDWLRTLFRATSEIPLFHILPLQETLPGDAAWEKFQASKSELAAKHGAHRAAQDVETIWQAWQLAHGNAGSQPTDLSPSNLSAQ